jgi:hypothetical protein
MRFYRTASIAPGKLGSAMTIAKEFATYLIRGWRSVEASCASNGPGTGNSWEPWEVRSGNARSGS